jgi:hypothetical protein
MEKLVTSEIRVQNLEQEHFLRLQDEWCRDQDRDICMSMWHHTIGARYCTAHLGSENQRISKLAKSGEVLVYTDS